MTDIDDRGHKPPVRPVPLLVTRPEAARILSLSVPEIDNLRRAGKLLAWKHGKRVLFTMTELERFAHVLPFEVDLERCRTSGIEDSDAVRRISDTQPLLRPE